MWRSAFPKTFTISKLTNRPTIHVYKIQDEEAYYVQENYLRDMTHPIYSHNKQVVSEPRGDGNE
jgi:hypothetical protein